MDERILEKAVQVVPFFTSIVAIVVLTVMGFFLVWDNSLWWDTTFFKAFATVSVALAGSLAGALALKWLRPR